MSNEALKIIEDLLTENHINYEFGTWNSDVVYPYFVGEYNESQSSVEDGFHETTFILNGFSKEQWIGLENAKATIENLFSSYTTITSSGSGISISYENALTIPTDDADFKRIQINLLIKEWRVNTNE